MEKITLLLFICTTQLFSQNAKPDTVFCDCHVAKSVIINGKAFVNKTIAPKGFGAIDEISGLKQNTKFAFEKEHNTAWYKLVMKASGKLTFDIIPTNPEDDYDFMIFKANNNFFCDSLLKHKIKPVRACISRDKKEIDGKTGLNHTSKELFIKKGIASAYAKVLEVKAGEIYYLVLDNVYENGDGHRINFEISELVSFKGVLKNEDDKPIKADVSLVDQRGNVILQTETKLDGTYTFTQTIVSNTTYDLTFYNDSSFSYSKTFTLKDTVELKALKTILPELKKGKKSSIGAINFYAGEDRYLPRSVHALRNLYKLLRKNPNLKIMVIGHCNGIGINVPGDISLSKARAKAIKNYLVLLKIDQARIETDGKGCSEMMYPYTISRTEREGEENRRVEIMVLDY